MNASINIPLSKNKLTWIIIASIFFIAFCFFMVLKANWIGDNNEAVKTISKYGGVAGTMFFIYTLLLAIKKRKDEKVGFCIMNEGFYDNSNSTNLGLIRWKDIKGFKEWNFEGTKSLVVLVDNPKDYIQMTTNFIAKKMLQANHKGCGSPIVVSATSLAITYEHLKAAILEGYTKYGEININHKN